MPGIPSGFMPLLPPLIMSGVYGDRFHPIFLVYLNIWNLSGNGSCPMPERVIMF